MTWEIRQGDALSVLREMEPESVQTCACGCGEPVESDPRGRPRKFAARGHNLRRLHNFMAQPGAVNPFQGQSHSEETRHALSEKASRPKPWLRGDGNGMAGRTGTANPNYKDGSSPERQRLYAGREWKRVSRLVRERDGYRCQRCGAEKQGRRSLHLHHLKPWAEHPELRFDPDNITTLCRACHHAAHRKGGGA